MNRDVFKSAAEMFAAIRDKNGVLKPTQHVPNGRKIIRLAGLQDNPETYTTQSAGKQGK